MPQLIAIEWDSREARLAVASVRAGELVIEETFSIDLPQREEGHGGVDPRVGDKIEAALAARMIRRADALVAVGRANIELKSLTLPPAPDEELPEMVRWQATREFHSLGDDWPLDFIPQHDAPDQPRTVLAAAIAPELVDQIRQTCEAAGLAPQRLVLRPCAAASLFLRGPQSGEHQVRLLVDLLAAEADLTALDGQEIVFLRTARLPGDVLSTPEGHGPIVAEVRRTMAAVQNQLGGRPVEAIYLCGVRAEHAALAEQFQRQFGLPARLFDPLDGLPTGARLRSNLPEDIGRFAPLLGMLADEATEARPKIDFLHPRHTPEPPSQRRTYAMAAAAVAALLVLVGIGVWWYLGRLDNKAEQLANRSQQLDSVVRQANELQRAVNEIEKWTGGDLVWLDELAELSADFPHSKEAMLTQLRFNSAARGGVIQLEGYVNEAQSLDQLERSLRDDHHRVEGQGRQQDRDMDNYQWQFKSSVLVEPQNKQDYQKRKQDSSTEADKPQP